MSMTNTSISAFLRPFLRVYACIRWRVNWPQLMVEWWFQPWNHIFDKRNNPSGCDSRVCVGEQKAQRSGIMADIMATSWTATPERWVTIDHSALAHNIDTIARWVKPAQVMAVVKADGYGHGAVEVAQTAVAAGATWLGTAHVREALSLREAGITAPLVAWLHTISTPFE